MAKRKPQEINVTEPTTPIVDNSPAKETPVAHEHPKLKPNQHITIGGAVRTDH